MTNNNQLPTMYIKNRRDSSKFKGCSPFQLSYNLTEMKPAIGYYSYTYRCAPLGRNKIDKQNTGIIND